MRLDPPVRVRTAPLGGERMGLWDEASRTVWLDVGLTAVELRCTLAHELVHAERGDVPCADPVLESRQELRVERIAAGRLVSVVDLVEAVRWSADPAEIAALLGVDQQILAARIELLTAREWRLLRAARPA